MILPYSGLNCPHVGFRGCGNHTWYTEVRLRFVVGDAPAAAHDFVARSSDADALRVNNLKTGAGGKYSYEYTGQHDDGDLPTLREGGHYARLARSLTDAKVRRHGHVCTRAY